MKRLIQITLLVLITMNAYPQLGEKVYYKSPIYVEAGTGYQKYSMGDTSISLLYFPVSVMIPLTSDLSVSVSNNPYMITRKLTNGEVKVNNISDTKLNGRYIFLNRKALINIFVNIPTGKTKLELDQFDVFTDLSLSILKYKVAALGEGFNTGVGLNYAFPVTKRSTIGFGLSYNNKMEYEPINFEKVEKNLVFKYNPSDEIGFNISYFNSLSERVKLSLDLYYTTYSYAKINSIDIYKPGGSLSSILALSFSTGEVAHFLFLNGRFYSQNKEKRLDVWTNYKNSYQIDADYKITKKVFNDIDLFGVLQARNYGEYQDNWNGIIYTVHESSMYSFGFGLKIPLLNTLYLNTLAKYNTGKVKMAQDMNINGWDISLKLNYAF